VLPSANRLQGVFSPVLTPFHADCTPDAYRFVRHCRWLVGQDVGLAVFGTNSEANSLALSEKRKLLDVLLEAGVPPSRMMPGTGSCAVPETIEITKHAVQAGCASVLMLPPFYYKGVSDEGLYRSFANIIEGVADDRLRIYLYHIPSVSQVPITRTLVSRLMDSYPGIVAGMKDSSGDWKNTQSMLKEFGPRGFNVFAGSENFLLATLRAGGAGCITATGNVNPGPIVQLFKTWREPDADEKQKRLDATRSVFANFPMIAAMKAAIAWKTGRKDWAHVRPPLVALNAEQQKSLQQGLEAVHFELPDAGTLG
jgi:4-hydroxy-tetrahydrodipicolinate synthase